ncbi:nitrate reductase molybdenum cofactor assembly chaperone [Streptomyces odontomachi]|uniref:nitrate reductase molybdenum cofactor assembly chaperone n=1 Tax=Streptomyces odontomachi TaxID=2944940 RepID=UPI00210D30C4|nr:nitrate reductase molybdenum cofactor assembly chaperone [Streptomyces sp. ODS25]
MRGRRPGTRAGDEAGTAPGARSTTHAGPTPPAPDTAAVHQAAALLLGYPDEGWPARLTLVREAIERLPGPGPGTAPLLRFCATVQDTPVLDLAAGYVTTFDRSRRRTLHLTYYTDGDTRRRGAALAALKARYRAHGWQPPEDELPDHLPLVLEFAARCPDPGSRLLQDHRAGLELLRMALTDRSSPYADVLAAVCATVPEAPPDRAAALALARSGPPTELVGLAPYPLDAPRGTALRATEGPGR